MIATTMLLPLGLALVGFWEWHRGTRDWAEADARRRTFDGVVAHSEARAPPPDVGVDLLRRLRSGGRTYVGPDALEQARAVRDEAASVARVMDGRLRLPPVVLGAGVGAAALSLVTLVTGIILGWAGRRSRDRLVQGFTLVWRVLPAALSVQILALTAGSVCAIGFVAGGLVQPHLDADAPKLLFASAVFVLLAVLVAASAVLRLRRVLGALEPDPLPILGRVVSVAEAPGLWDLAEAIAGRLGAHMPEAVVVGLTGSFFVSSGPALLQPEGGYLTGRILYLPLPLLALLDSDEVAVILAHELAHYAGGDTAYGQRFLPIYMGIGRSLAVVAAHRGGFGLVSPSLHLGLFVMDRFHRAVRHWSRARELAADAAAAGAVSAEASVRALLRVAAVGPRVAETLDAAVEAPDSAPADLVAAALAHARARGFDDPAAHLDAGQPHPTDTHPTTRDRVAALGRTIDAKLLAAACAVPPPDAIERLAAYFADPGGVCRAATADFIDPVRAREAEFRRDLEATAAAIEPGEQVLRENTWPRALALTGAGCTVSILIPFAIFAFIRNLPDGAWLAAVAALTAGVILVKAGIARLRQTGRVTLILNPDGLAVPGLDTAIAWDGIAHLDMRAQLTQAVIRLLLAPDALFPPRTPGARGVTLDARRRVITIVIGLPHGMTRQAFLNLIGRYRAAARARQFLAAIAADTPSSSPEIARGPMSQFPGARPITTPAISGTGPA